MRALLSVYDKEGVVEFARGLAELDVELVASGGTAKVLEEAGLHVTRVGELTGFEELLGHRVVTLHPAVFAGILADLDVESHRRDLAEAGIEPFDLVVVNLYPFGSDPSVELIDIGGPAMVRAAAKNHAHVAVVVDPEDYPLVLDELRRGGRVEPETRRRLARRAFATTAALDGAIVSWLDGDELLPETLHLDLERSGEPLRYGENPHQRAAWYRELGEPAWWEGVAQLAGVAPSYLNVFDADAAWGLVLELRALGGPDEHAAVIVKHANPCGAALAESAPEAYRRALAGDERSAFGGIVACSSVVDAAVAEAMVAGPQADVVIAPGFDADGVRLLTERRKSTRLLSAPPPSAPRRHLRQAGGGWLVQEPYAFGVPRSDWRVVTKRVPTEAEWADAELAWRLVGWVRSNAVVLVKDRQAVGIGAGQQSRVEAGQIAAAKAAGRAVGGASASDAFYPFPDGVEAASAAGCAVVVQPGGSVRDAEVVARADELGLAMVLTGERQFRH